MGGKNVWKGVKVPHMGKLGQQKKMGMFGLKGWVIIIWGMQMSPNDHKVDDF